MPSTKIDAIPKNESDPLEYRVVVLENEMKVLLIRDRDATKSSAAVAVHVGSFRDPSEFQGLAHFLEHMLFMGSEKYPDEAQYREFVTKNGGSTNAYTSVLLTNYFFDCSNVAFYEALDIFSCFFKCPLFDSKWVAKEVNAVNSEAEMNLNSDFWRTFQLLKSFGKEGHYLTNFTIGNNQTLQAEKLEELVGALKAFHKRHYSSNLMSMVVCTPDELDAMQQKVEGIFADIPNHQIAYRELSEDGFPYGQADLGKYVKVTPVNEDDLMKFYFMLPSFHEHRRNKVSEYWSHLLGHESEGSIFHFLQKEGLATSLSSGAYVGMEGLLTCFSIDVTLTKKGLREQEKVAEVVGAYLRKMREAGAQEWVFQELKDLGDMSFKYYEKASGLNQCVSYAGSILDTDGSEEQLAELVRQKYVYREFDRQALDEFVGHLTLENCLLVVMSKEHEGATESEEKIFKTPYTRSEIPQHIKDAFAHGALAWKTSGAELGLPPRNTLIPKDFTIVQGERQAPQKVVDDGASTVWTYLDTEFRFPKTLVELKIFNDHNELYTDPKSSALQSLWVSCFNTELNPLNYLVQMAKSNFSISSGPGHLELSGKCYSDTLAPFLEKMLDYLERFRSFDDERQFEDQRMEMINDTKAILKMPPFRMGLYNYTTWLATKVFSPEEKIAALESLSFADFKQWREGYLSRVSFRWLLEGNISAEQAKQTAEHFQARFVQIFGSQALPEVRKVRPVRLQRKRCMFERQVVTKDEKNSCLLEFYQVGHGFDQYYAKLEVLRTWLHDEYFNEMRTKKTLGYVVFGLTRKSRGVEHFVLVVQSDVQSTDHVVQQNAQFLQEWRGKLQEMTEETFEQIKQGCIAKECEKYLNMGQVHADHSIELETREFRFDRKQAKGEELARLTKKEVEALYDEIFLNNPRVLEVHYYSPAREGEGVELRKKRQEAGEIEFFESPEEFITSQELMDDPFYSQ